jgi:lipoprotein-anchoring transpeptidase ErfK/SrfK
MMGRAAPARPRRVVPRLVSSLAASVSAGALLVAASSPSAAQPRGAVSRDGLAPRDPAVRSLRIVEEGAVVRAEPREGAARRGTIVAGTRVAPGRRVAGAGCPTGVWAEIGADAWLCESATEGARAEPAGVLQPPLAPGALLPFSYAFVGFDATRAYLRPSDYDADEYAEAYGEGFGLAVRGRMLHDGVPFVVTRAGRFVPEEGLRFARPSDFAGVALTGEAPLDVAWARRDGVVVTSSARRGRPLARLARLSRVRVLGEERGMLRVSLDAAPRTEADAPPPVGYVAARDLTRPTLSPRPAEVGAGERWLDVDTATQTLVAYEGDRPRYATLVSTGRAGPGTETPRGVHRIWVKLATSDMDDLEREDVERNYRIEAVPWVQFFAGSAGLHAAFWHTAYGTRHSHGCVNLSSRDARALFDFTGPALPPGWSAVLPTERDRGTAVRVR